MSVMFVPLGPAVHASLYDEVAIYASELTGPQVADHYGGSLVSPLADPQSAAIGYEEVYGSEYPLTVGDVPVLTNGLARCRYLPLLPGWALDAWLPGIGWQEQGRVYVRIDDTLGAGVIVLPTLQACTITEWTPERGVMSVVFTGTSGGNSYRCMVYVTLQRGWLGPRLEVYPSPRGAVALGAGVRYVGYGGAYPNAVFGDGGLAYAAAPWLALVGPPRTTAMTWARIPTVDVPSTGTEAVAYGATRTYMQVMCAQGSSGQGYCGARFSHGMAGGQYEAEAYMVAGGTRSQVANGGAANGQALKDTQTAATAVSATLPATVTDRLPLGRYQLWARVLIGTAGDTLSARGTFRGDVAAPVTATATSTAAAFTWVYVGEAMHDALNEPLDLTIWRSAGTGVAGELLDEVALVPVEGRQATTDPAYGGARDLAQEHLYDTQAEPELVAR